MATADALRTPAEAERGYVSRLPGLVFDRLLPASFFGLFCGLKATLVASALASLLRSAPTFGQAGPAALRATDQALGLGYFGLISFLCITRLPRRSGRRDPSAVALSLFASFAIMVAGVLPDRQARPQAELLADLLLAAGLAYSVWALVWLRRSFSILPEARRLVTGGPYALSRHPLYLGEALATVGLLIPIAGWMAAALAACAAGAQLIRIRWEEAVLAAEFPDYTEYARRVPRYLPSPR